MRASARFAKAGAHRPGANAPESAGATRHARGFSVLHQEQLLWVAAYIDHTSIHGRQKLYDDAIAYYRELEKRPLRMRLP
jgi:hypothetical protein